MKETYEVWKKMFTFVPNKMFKNVKWQEKK